MEDVILNLKRLHEFNPELDDDRMQQKLQQLETTRYINCWGDHTTIGGHSYVLYTFSCLYDKAIFYNKGIALDIEEFVQPQIHILSRCRKTH